jgi:hypothetical protein
MTDDLVQTLPDGRLFVSDEVVFDGGPAVRFLMDDMVRRSNAWHRSEHGFGWVFDQPDETGVET